MTGTGRVLVSAFGSPGDVFPLVPIIARLRDEGHDVRCAVSRSIQLPLRALGLPTYGLGSGAEMRVFDDDRVISNRFGGWASWRSLVTEYLVPSLRADVELLGRIFAMWRPDVVVTGSFSPAARVAARLHKIPRLEVTIYPQHRHRLARARSFGLPVRNAVAQLYDPCADPRSDVVSDLTWGAGPDGLVLHDRAVLAHLDGDRALDGPDGVGKVVGFPYWDQAPARPDDGEAVDRWLDRTQGPVVAVTVGSFLGARQKQVWVEAARAIDALGVQGVFVGPRGQRGGAWPGIRAELLTVGFVPLSRITHRVNAVVHHGGVGTMFGTLGAGRPAVVVPQAFDQSFNARLIASTGAGIDASNCPLHHALAKVLGEPRFTAAARRLAGELVPSHTATERVVERVAERVA